MSTLRILIADDHTLVRAGFRSLLEKVPDCAVVAEVGDGREALRLVAQLQPDVVLMDVRMPELNGLQATAHIKRLWPQVKVIVLSMYAEYQIEAMNAGADVFVAKDEAPHTLLQVLAGLVEKQYETRKGDRA